MSSLLTIAECRALVKTALSDEQLQTVINRVEAQITARIGAAQDDTGNVQVVETVAGEDEHLFLRVPATAIVSVVEDDVTVDAGDYRLWGESGMIQHLPTGSQWGAVCTVTYKPADMREERKTAAIELVRLTVERTAMVNESIAGEYSYTAPDWDAQMNRILRKLCFTEV